MALLYPAVPPGGRVLGAEDVLLFNPPFAGVRPPDLVRPSNWLLVDPVEVFHPDLQWAHDQIRSGSPPLWNPSVGAGTPQFASQQTAVLYPLNLLALVLPFWQSLGVIAALKLVIVGVGTTAFARAALGLHTLPAAFAGVAFAAGVYFVAWLEHPHSNVYALLPWLLLATHRVSLCGRAADAAVLAGLVGIALLGGHPQSVFMIGLVVGAFAVWRLAFEPRDRNDAAPRGRAAGRMVAAGVVGVAAGAIVLLPLIEVIGMAERPARGGIGGLRWESLYTLILPDLWGRPGEVLNSLGGPPNYAERTIYVGAPALMLAVAGLSVRPQRDQLFMCGVAVASILLAIRLPVVTHLVDTLPAFSSVAMVRAMVLLSFALAILSGYGLQRLLDADALTARRMLLAAGMVALLPVLWIFTQGGETLRGLDAGLLSIPGVRGVPHTQADASAGAVLRWIALALPTFAALVIASRRRSAVPIVCGILLVLLAFDLVESGRGFHPAIDEGRAQPAATASIDFASRNAGTGRIVGEGEFLLANVGQRYGLRDARIHSVPVLRRYSLLWSGLGGRGYQATRFATDASRAKDLLDSFGVTMFLRGPGSSATPLPQTELVQDGPDAQVYRNPTALPRAYVATSWRTAEDELDGVRKTIADGASLLRSSPVIERAAPPPPGGAQLADADTRFVVDGANGVRVDVRSAAPGYLVLLDSYFPGWTAKVNGKAETILPANGAFRAVAVPAGHSRVEFTYRPRSVLIGLLISGLAWLSIVAAASTVRMRPRASPR